MYLFKPQTYMYFTWKAYPTLEEICEYNWSLRNTEVQYTTDKNGFIWHVKPYKGQFALIYNWNDLIAMKKYGTRTISIGGKDEDKVLSYIPKFTGENWHSFEPKMITYLETKGLYGTSLM